MAKEHKLRLLIIGATSYIGQKLLLTKPNSFKVVGTSSQNSNNFLLLNLNDPLLFDYKSVQLNDVVFLTAAISSPDVCAKEYDHAWKVNVTGTSEFITRITDRGACVIFFSSDTVYGNRTDEFDERADCNPSSEYAQMKHEVEKRFSGNSLFKAIRLSYVFSREDKFTKYLSECVDRGDEAKVFHPFYRAVIHRDDVVKGAIALAEHWKHYPQPVINFGGPEVLARTDFAKVLRDTALPKLNFKVVEPEEKFFLNRPKIIRMKSPILASLLKQPARTLSEATKLEFNKSNK